MLRKLTVRDQALALRGGNWQECARACPVSPERNDDAVRALTRQSTAQPNVQVNTLSSQQSTRRSHARARKDEPDITAAVTLIGWVLFQDLEEVERFDGGSEE